MTLFTQTLLITLLISQSLSCSSKPKSILTGAAIGSGIGTVIGHQHSGNQKSRIVGAASGTLLGGLIGYLYNGKPKPQVAETEFKPQLPLKDLSPSLTRSKVSMYWEPDKIEGNKFIEKHRVWILESGPHWTR